MQNPEQNYIIEQIDEITAVKCPCGLSRRAFLSKENSAASMHTVQISKDAKTHYHKKLTELYLILEGTGHIELDGRLVAVKPWTAIQIKPLCRHRAIGNLHVLVVVIPAFDPQDEWFDDT
jgi:mannose-6-phosphate isomerase-like protein (cupin superfamily)